MSIADIRGKLDQQIAEVQDYIRQFKFQEAERSLSNAEATYALLQKSLDTNNKTHVRIAENRLIKMETLSRNIEDGLRRREIGKREDGNIAFKCNWNDKLYKGVCSNEAYQYNQIYGGPWCRHQHGKCRKLINFVPIPTDCCYEARALIDFKFGAGWDHDEHGNMIRPRTIQSAREGKIALLTTIPPGTWDRFVVGAFLIKEVLDDPGIETYIIGDPTLSLDNMLSYKIRFWDFHENTTNPSSTAWATGLFRYVSNTAVFGILEAYISRTDSTEDVTKAGNLLKRFKSTCC